MQNGQLTGTRLIASIFSALTFNHVLAWTLYAVVPPLKSTSCSARKHSKTCQKLQNRHEQLGYPHMLFFTYYIQCLHTDPLCLSSACGVGALVGMYNPHGHKFVCSCPQRRLQTWAADKMYITPTFVAMLICICIICPLYLNLSHSPTSSWIKCNGAFQGLYHKLENSHNLR